MIENIKNTFKLFIKNIYDYLTISLAFAFITYLSIIGGYLIFKENGLIISFTLLIIPILIGLKYVVFHAISNGKVEYQFLKVGFLTYFRSIRIYLFVILKPLFVFFLSYLFITMISSGLVISILTTANPDLLDSSLITNFEGIRDLIDQNESASLIMKIGTIVSIEIGLIAYTISKSTRNFIPYLAFEMPINISSAEELNKKIIEGHNSKYILSNFLISILFIIPVLLIFILNEYVLISEALMPNTIFLSLIGVFLFVSAPIFTLLQINGILLYKKLSKPFQDDFKKELQKIIEEIQKIDRKK